MLVTDFEGIGGVFELDFELHHGGGLAGADDGGQGANGGHGLRQIGVFGLPVELRYHRERYLFVVIVVVRRRMDGGGLGLSEPVGAHYPELNRSVLVIRRCLLILHSMRRRFPPSLRKKLSSPFLSTTFYTPML